MRNSLPLLIALALAGTAPVHALAGDMTPGSLLFQGELNASTCQVSNGTGGVVSVTLPSISTQDLQTAGVHSSASTDASIEISGDAGCTNGDTVLVRFTDNADVDQRLGRIKPQVGDGFAENVYIELFDEAGNVVSMKRDSLSPEAVIGGNRARIPLRARYYTENGNVTPGRIEGRAQFTLEYK